MNGINLVLLKNGNGYDITNLIESITWSGRTGAAFRTLTVSLLDDNGHNHARAEIDVTQGNQCIFSYNGAELFRGMLFTQKQGLNKKLSFTAYDNGVRLKDNKDTFSYTDITVSEIFADVCKRFGLSYSDEAQTTYRIPELIKSKTTAWDVLADALSQDYKVTGVRKFIKSKKGVLKLTTRRENITQWVVETGQNLTAYNYSQSIEKVKTRITLLSKEDTVISQKINSALESKIGIAQEIQKPDESLNAAQLDELANSTLAELGLPERNLTVESLGIADVISGVGVYVIIDHLGIKQTFYVDEDSHTFSNNNHRMKLTLNFAADVNPIAGAAAGGIYSIGDVVQFLGGYHYVSSNAESPTGGYINPGPARLTLVAKGAKHPYHLIHTNSQSRVYGWVDERSFEKWTV
jgi:hypothetical protein